MPVVHRKSQVYNREVNPKVHSVVSPGSDAEVDTETYVVRLEAGEEFAANGFLQFAYQLVLLIFFFIFNNFLIFF